VAKHYCTPDSIIFAPFVSLSASFFETCNRAGLFLLIKFNKINLLFMRKLTYLCSIKLSNMKILIKYNKKGAMTKRFNGIDDAVDYMDGNDFSKYKIWKVSTAGTRKQIFFKSSNLSIFKKQLQDA